jgi:hypothetical protein
MGLLSPALIVAVQNSVHVIPVFRMQTVPLNSACILRFSAHAPRKNAICGVIAKKRLANRDTRTAIWVIARKSEWSFG